MLTYPSTFFIKCPSENFLNVFLVYLSFMYSLESFYKIFKDSQTFLKTELNM
jgi:hypothetical protein